MISNRFSKNPVPQFVDFTEVDDRSEMLKKGMKVAGEECPGTEYT